MKKYIVQWENEIWDVDSPLEATKQCCNDISCGQTLGFTVTDLETGEKFHVDLSEHEEDQIYKIK